MMYYFRTETGALSIVVVVIIIIIIITLSSREPEIVAPHVPVNYYYSRQNN